MASINGLTVKAMKTFRDHEGCEIAQGNLYLGNKKIGFWSQDFMGGPDVIDLDRQYDVRKLEKWFEDRDENLDLVLWNLLILKEKETEWKKWKCERVFYATDGYHIITVGMKNPRISASDILDMEEVQKILKEDFTGGIANAQIEILAAETFDDAGEQIPLEEIKR